MGVSFKQQLASLSRIPLSADRRDRFNSPTDILTGRLIDRCIRPVFKGTALPDVEVTCSVLADDFNNDPDVVAINAASTAVGLSGVPGFGVVGAVRVSVNESASWEGFVINPTRQQRYDNDLDLVLATDVKGNITAIQSGCNKVPKDLFIEALKAGTLSATELANAIHDFTLDLSKISSEELNEISSSELSENLFNKVYSFAREPLVEIFKDKTHDKISRDEAIKLVQENTKNHILKQDTEENETADSTWELIHKHQIAEDNETATEAITEQQNH